MTRWKVAESVEVWASMAEWCGLVGAFEVVLT